MDILSYHDYGDTRECCLKKDSGGCENIVNNHENHLLQPLGL